MRIEIGIIILVFGSSLVAAGDLALGQPANMVNDEPTAPLAVDGTTPKCAVTSLLTDPWWRVDLGMSYIVEEVKIISGVNGLTNLEIRIGDSLDNEGNSNQQCGGPYTMTSSQEKSFHCTPDMRGRYVNIRTTGNNKKLEICEVLVNPNPTVNLALGQSASQSTVDHEGAAGRAIDGNTASRWDMSSCTRTATQTDPWWRGDLGSSQHVSEVFIVNRVGIKTRLRNIEIRVGDSLTNNGNSNPRCGGLYSMATLYKASFYCKPRKTGRYLNIRLVGNGMVLTLCEVEVYSESRAILKNKPKTPTTKDVYDRTSLTLLCPEPFGYPEPFVAWVRDGVVLQNSSWDLGLNLSIAKQNDTKWTIDCVASNKHGDDYYTFILNLHSQYAMCTDYKDITGETRTVFHVAPNQVSAQNDGDMNAVHWYRLFDHVTSKPMQLPDSCQDPSTCGTQAPGWLRGGHPSPEDYAVLRTVCFSWNGNCCFAEVQAHVRHCYGYCVYKLQPTTFGVKTRYCTENSAIDQKDALFYHTTSRVALEGHVIHLEYLVNSSWKCMVYCLVEKTCVSFNYHPHSGACEINNSTGSSHPDSLRERPGIEYYEKMNPTLFRSERPHGL